MANRRPIRAPRQGWRRGRRRPTRWIDCFSAAAAAEGGIGAGSIVVSNDVATASYRELVVGDLDTEWADANEVVLERVVGGISLRGADYISGIDDSLSLYNAGGLMPPVVRLGLLVVEDTDEDSPPDVPTMWEADDLQDTEWMWLHQVGSPTWSHVHIDGAAELVHLWTHDVHIDVRVKRKLGRRDRLVLCHDWNLRTAGFSGTHNVGVHPQLRCLVSTK